MILRDQLLHHAAFTVRNNIFYQKDFKSDSFEKAYMELRAKENRKSSDEAIKNLPEVEKDSPFNKEWAMRKSSLEKILHYLRKKEANSIILELGCGNGWLAHRLAESLNAEVCAMDVNETELLQGARVFKNVENLLFIHGDIFSSTFESQRFDQIILAGTIQYFSQLKPLISKLLTLLNHKGEIHIFDSPIFTSEECARAKKRSAEHFDQLGVSVMSDYYHYHDWNSLNGFNYEVLYNPTSLMNRVKRIVFKAPLSPFPWIRIES